MPIHKHVLIFDQVMWDFLLFSFIKRFRPSTERSKSLFYRAALFIQHLSQLLQWIWFILKLDGNVQRSLSDVHYESLMGFLPPVREVRSFSQSESAGCGSPLLLKLLVDSESKARSTPGSRFYQTSIFCLRLMRSVLQIS